MKYLLLTSLFLIGCYHSSNLKKDPHWKYNEVVSYDVPDFYTTVCDGKGKVSNKTIYETIVIYTIEPDMSKSVDCFNVSNTINIEFQKD